MGEVWLAEHVVLHVDVAIKILAPTAACNREAVERAAESFRAEAQLAAQLGARSPHVVRVVDAGVAELGPYLVMERVRGSSLAEVLVDGPLPPFDVASLIDQLADALDTAHGHGVVHRDIKPGNILVTRHPDRSIEVKLGDFGVAKILGPGLRIDGPRAHLRGALVGTPGYMSPEQLLDTSIDARADLWALGVVAYEALTACAPFASSGPFSQVGDVVMGRHVPLSTRRCDLPAELDLWFERALAKDRECRFDSARQMARAFRRSLAPETHTAPSVRLPADALGVPVRFFRSRPAKRYALAACAMASFGVFAALFPRMSSHGEASLATPAIAASAAPASPTVEVASVRVEPRTAPLPLEPRIPPVATSVPVVQPAPTIQQRPSKALAAPARRPPWRPAQVPRLTPKSRGRFVPDEL